MKPKKRTTKKATRTRRSHHALKPVQIVKDEQGNPHLPHRAAPATGTYRGRKAVDAAKRVTRRARRTKKLG